jgi:hypothetical protein
LEEEREARDWGEEALGKVRVFTVFIFRATRARTLTVSNKWSHASTGPTVMHSEQAETGGKKITISDGSGEKWDCGW